MAGNNKMILLLALVMSMAMSASAARYVVGGSAGWTIPSTSSLYSQWASSQKYAVGDTLLFNFTTGTHNVMEVPKASYDSCSTTNQIGSTLTTGPATVTLTKPGNHYFICGVAGHCSLGQKLTVNVVASSSSPPKAAPAPASTPASATSYVVGGSAGWTIPSTSSLYSQWASSQKYAVGDTLLFNFTTGTHNVIEVPKASYDSCSTTNQIGSTLTTGPATVTLTKPGNHYFICGVAGHCSLGQKLAVNVVSSASSPPKAASTPAPAPAAAPKVATTAAPASSPTGGPAPSIAPTNSRLASGPGPATSPSSSQSPPSTAPESPATNNGAPSSRNGGSGSSLGPASSNQNPTAAAGPSDGGNSGSSAPASMLSGRYSGSIVVAAFFSAAFLW